MGKRKSSQSAADIDAVLDEITDLVAGFCLERLNDEYLLLCREMAETLAGLRPCPFLKGTAASWASGIVRAVGSMNFISDPSQTPHMTMADIDAGFGISPATGAARVRDIRRLLNLMPLHPAWTLPSRLDDNPLVWMLEVNGFLMDIRHAPREAQAVAYDKGLIPWIPADRAADPA
jgi:Domain of unknown function (DUF6398)